MERTDILFELLDAWRDLPAYKLEPRVDVIFASYLREALQQNQHVQLLPQILPELPLRRGSLWGEDVTSPNKSVKVDFALFTIDGSAVYLVELKTDTSSRREEQDDYLQKAASIGWRAIIDGIPKIMEASGSKYLQKYVHLVHRLSELGYLKLPHSLFDLAFPAVSPGYLTAIRSIENTTPLPAPTVKVLYVQPLPDSSRDVIPFDEFARVVASHPDKMSKTFSEYLRRWQAPAGAVSPLSTLKPFPGA